MLLPFIGGWQRATATRACLPYWLETVGWLAAMLSDATAAGMGRLPSLEPPLDARSRVSTKELVKNILEIIQFVPAEHRSFVHAYSQQNLLWFSS